MGIFNRVKTIATAKADKVLDKTEDPIAELDMAYNKQLEMLTKIKRGTVEISTQRKKIELEVTNIQKEIETRNNQAQAALQQGREDLAREALTRKAALMDQVAQMKEQYDSLVDSEQKMIAAQGRAQEKIDKMRQDKETIKARYRVAQSTAQVTEAFSGIAEDSTYDAGAAINKIEEKTREMQARGLAVTELEASGVLGDQSGWASGDDIERELNSLSSSSSVELELEAMKAQYAPALEAGKTDAKVDDAVDADTVDDEDADTK